MLIPGTKLGPYEILAAAGAGGMGEVYRSRDTRLDRTVAIKVVSAALTGSPELRERFDREARAISALNHPHICALYDVGHEAGVDFLVMEFVDGETLEARLAKGPLPMADVLRHGIEIASALDAAHRQGIVHRDLKPGNVMLTKAGAKLLDFGLAKQAPASPAAGLTMLPTTPSNLTAAGTILGTFQYMAPEQLEGVDADARADIFAFGAVMYEMASGRKAFAGKSQATLIAAIVSADPPALSSLQPLATAGLDRVIARCLIKDPEDRWQSMRDVLGELRWIAAGRDSTVPPVVLARRRPIALRATIALLALATAVSGSIALRSFSKVVGVAPLMRFQTSMPVTTGLGAWMAVSPDGRTIAFVARGSTGGQSIFTRSLDAFSSRELTQVRDFQGSALAWSPDSRRIAFTQMGKLRTVEASTGSVDDLATVATDLRSDLRWGVTGDITSRATEPNKVNRATPKRSCSAVRCA